MFLLLSDFVSLIVFLGLLRYKVDFQSLQLDELDIGEEFDLDDY